MRYIFVIPLLIGCGGSVKDKGEIKLKAAKPEAVEALRDAARLQRLGPANYERALERLQGAVLLDDQLWEAWYDIGWLELRRHRATQAAAALEKAATILPTRIEITEALAQAYLESGRAGDAAAAYKKFLERKPDAPLKVKLAEALRRAGKLDEAAEVLQKALRAAPRTAAALSELGLVYLARGQQDLADLVLRRALEIDDKSKASAPTWNNLGLIALARRRDQEAFAHFEQASKLDPSLTVARRNKALVYLDCGDYARAADELKQVVRADAGDLEAWVALGVAERGAGRLGEALKAYEHALDLAPGASDALYDLAILYMDFKRDNLRALEKLKEFLDSAPRSHPKRSDAESRMKELAPKAPPAGESKS